MSAVYDLVLKVHLHRDCDPEYAEWEAWAQAEGDPDEPEPQWIARGTAPSLAGAMDKACECLQAWEEGGK